MINTLVADVAAHDWHLNVGIVGIKYVLPTLSRNGRGDVALGLGRIAALYHRSSTLYQIC